MILASISVLIGSTTTDLSHINCNSQVVFFTLANWMVNVSMDSFIFFTATGILTTSLSFLYADGFVTSVCLLIMMIQLFLSGMVSRPYLPAGMLVPSMITSSPNVRVVALLAPVRQTLL